MCARKVIVLGSDFNFHPRRGCSLFQAKIQKNPILAIMLCAFSLTSLHIFASHSLAPTISTNSNQKFFIRVHVRLYMLKPVKFNSLEFCVLNDDDKFPTLQHIKQPSFYCSAYMKNGRTQKKKTKNANGTNTRIFDYNFLTQTDDPHKPYLFK